MIDSWLLKAEVKLASSATRARLLRERRRCQQRGWKVPAAKEVLRAPQGYELLLMCQRFLGRPAPTALIDVGANTGYWAERFLRYIPATYVGIEPDPRAFTELSQRFPKEQLINAAAGGHPGSVVLHMTELSAYSTISAYRDFASRNVRTSDEVAVERVTLNQYVRLAPGTRAVVKVDVQGAESEVLEGATKLLPAVDLLLLEAPLFPQTELTNDLGTLSAIVRPYGLTPIYFCRPGLDFDRYTVPVEHDVIFGRLDGRSWDGCLSR
jgi:FkbM family methyltransferase